MQNSTVFQIISTIEPKEYRLIGLWLASPLHNKRQDVRDLFDILTKKKRLRPLSKQEAFAKIYPGSTYDDAKIRQVMYFLQKAVEDYLLYKAIKDNEWMTYQNLLAVYEKRRLEKPFSKTLTKALRRLEETTGQAPNLLLMHYLYRQREYDYRSSLGRFQELNLQPLSNSLERYFLAEKLRLACMMLSHERVYKSTYDKGLLPQILEYVEQKQWLDHPAVSLYYYSYKALTEADKTWFERLLQDMEKWKGVLAVDRKREILLLALNFCIGKINEGDKSYYKQSLQLYRHGLEEGTLLFNGRISRYTFINIAAAAVHEKEFDWVETLIQSYGHLIEERFRESTINYALIILNYNRKRFRKTMQLISQTHFDDPLTGLAAKATLAKIYFEQGEEEVLESYLDSLLTYLRRKDVMAYQREIYKTFARMLKKILHLPPDNKSARRELKDQIKSLEIYEKEWLLNQLN